jgi:phosphoribosylformimino-5-aminoimidazole carboxamide ribotide isomerase
MAGFTIYPAIDLRQGQVVRLAQGDLSRQTTYASQPGDAARHWLQSGARWLHVVNLDGAFEQPDQTNRQALLEILQAAGEFSPAGQVQFGGGLRTMAALDQVLAAGVQRAVLGTAIIQTPELAEQAVRRYGAPRVAAGLDARQGQIMLRGWTEPGGLSAIEAARQLAQAGIQTIIFTDIARDGVSSGINLDSTLALKEASGLEVIASGGVRGLEDIRQACRAGLDGVIIGRALYEGTLNLEEALELEVR